MEFVTRKISAGAAKIKLGIEKEIRLGNLEARRDWGHARDYVRAMWLMLQQDEADDYVVGTGESHSVRELLEASFSYVGLDYSHYLVIDENLYRPAEVKILQGDASKARRILGWSPSVTFEELVKNMVESDLEWYSENKRF